MSKAIEAQEDEHVEQTETADTALAMSDEEFDKLTPEEFEALEGGSEDSGESATENENDEDNEDEILGDDNPQDDSQDDANGTDEPDSADEGTTEQADEGDDAEKSQPSEEELVAAQKKREEAFELLYGNPIKASGRNVQLRNPEHALNLIEMGVDYNKKMQNLKPHMKTLRTLEKAGLLEDEDTLNLLLEAQQGKPEALRALINKAEVDMVDIADDDGSTEAYKPENQIISEREVEIEDALSGISKSPAYNKTIDVMTNSFDPKSRDIISENPAYIGALNQDIETGVYEQIMDSVQYQKDMNMIPQGISDIEAYVKTAQMFNERKQQPQAQAQPNQQEQPTQPANRESKRRKVGMSNSKSSGKKREIKYDPLSMSDEDFMKIEGMNLL